jgi:hypothetical protein
MFSSNYRFGKAKRTKDIDTTPGPGEYLNDGSTKNKGFKYKCTNLDWVILNEILKFIILKILQVLEIIIVNPKQLNLLV